MQTYYSPIKPYTEHRLPVSDLHSLHLEECGRVNRIPVLILHGGPGAGCETYHRQLFDPDIYRIILVDQRGCGKSTPHGELHHNDTEHLIKDIETIRKFLNVDTWIIFGNDWGASLALVYAQLYPKNILGLILASIILARDVEITWRYQQGTNLFYPEHWHEFIRHIPSMQQTNIPEAYYHQLHGTDELAQMAAAKAWSLWEAQCSTLHPHVKVLEHFRDPLVAMNLGRIATHYLHYNYFLKPNQILGNMDDLRSIPGIIVHGRYDMICNLESAWELFQACPLAELNIIRDAGHAISEPGIIDSITQATRNMAARIR